MTRAIYSLFSHPVTDSDKDILHSVCATLRRGEEAVLGVSGRSMLPTLRPGGDVVLLRPVGPDEDDLRFRIVLAAVDDGRMVLHRVVGRSADGVRLVLMGDGNLKAREECARADVAGCVAGVMRPGRGRTVVPSRRFGRMWHWLLWARPMLLKITKIFH